MVAEIVPGVTADPKVSFGKAVIAGTRTPVALVLGQLAAGISEQERYGAWLADQEVVRATAG